jgi:predicted DNA-binding transcriptional regulator YafY
MGVARDAFLDEPETSLATFKRDLEYMRDRFNAPVVWDPDVRGYRCEKKGKAGPKFGLPGLWFTEDEAYALVTMQHLLSSLDDRELVLDILRHGAEVEVVSPATLRRKVRAEHERAAKLNG